MADGGSSFNPLLFSRIVPPRCDLYDKIVPYVRTLSVLPFARSKKRKGGRKKGEEERGRSVKNCPASRAIRYSPRTRKIPTRTSCIRSVSDSDELPVGGSVGSCANSCFLSERNEGAKERSSSCSAGPRSRVALGSLCISMPIRHVTLRRELRYKFAEAGKQKGLSSLKLEIVAPRQLRRVMKYSISPNVTSQLLKYTQA